VCTRFAIRIHGNGTRLASLRAIAAVITLTMVKHRNEVRGSKQARHVELADGPERFAAATAA
jgi:hypothetical protein